MSDAPATEPVKLLPQNVPEWYMRTCVLINMRGAHQIGPGVCWNLWKLAARPDLVTFGLRVDEDDEETLAAVKRLAQDMPNVNVFTGPRPMFPGAESTMMAQHIKAGWYTILNDDTFPMSWNWDVALHAARHQRPDLHLFGWKCYPPQWQDRKDAEGNVVLKDDGKPERDPAFPADYLIWRREWFEAAGQRLFVGHWPYWFEDYYIGQIHFMLYQNGVPLLPPELAGRKHTRTKRMRDFAFWRDYYRVLEPERIALAHQIGERIGRPLNLTDELLQHLRDNVEEHLGDKRMGPILDALSDPSPPDEMYLKAMEIAKAHMAAVQGEPPPAPHSAVAA